MISAKNPKNLQKSSKIAISWDFGGNSDKNCNFGGNRRKSAENCIFDGIGAFFKTRKSHKQCVFNVKYSKSEICAELRFRRKWQKIFKICAKIAISVEWRKTYKNCDSAELGKSLTIFRNCDFDKKRRKIAISVELALFGGKRRIWRVSAENG